MAFPFLSETGFESGTLDHFDTEIDSANILDFAHFSELARTPRIAMPYRGAYAMRIAVNGGTTDAYVQETGSWNTPASGVIWFRFMFWLGGPNLAAPDAALFSIFQLWSGTNTVEATVGVQYTVANGWRLFANKTASPTGASFAALSANAWHCIEIRAAIDGGVANDGALEVFLDGFALTPLTGLDQGAITSGVMGLIGPSAGIFGTLLFDEVIADDTRIYPPVHRFPEVMLLTKSAHVFVGNGTVYNTRLLSGAATNNVLRVFDTDVAYVLDASNILDELKNTVSGETVDSAATPYRTNRGCYVELTGTNPRALITVGKSPIYSNDAAMRTYGLIRKNTPGNT